MYTPSRGGYEGIWLGKGGREEKRWGEEGREKKRKEEKGQELGRRAGEETSRRGKMVRVGKEW